MRKRPPADRADDTRPEDIPERFPTIQTMMALSDIARDYEKGKITKEQLWARLRETALDGEAAARAYVKLTGEAACPNP